MKKKQCIENPAKALNSNRAEIDANISVHIDFSIKTYWQLIGWRYQFCYEDVMRLVGHWQAQFNSLVGFGKKENSNLTS